LVIEKIRVLKIFEVARRGLSPSAAGCLSFAAQLGSGQSQRGLSSADFEISNSEQK
jgi:hypothetical protein